jgi:hypothetical protein
MSQDAKDLLKAQIQKLRATNSGAVAAGKEVAATSEQPQVVPLGTLTPTPAQPAPATPGQTPTSK